MLSYQNTLTTGNNNYDNNGSSSYPLYSQNHSNQFNTANNLRVNNSQYNQFDINPYSSKFNNEVGSNNPFSDKYDIGNNNQSAQVCQGNYLSGNNINTPLTAQINQTDNSSEKEKITGEEINNAKPLPKEIRKAIDSLIAAQPYCDSSSEVIDEVLTHFFANTGKTQEEFLESLSKKYSDDYPRYEKEVKHLLNCLNNPLGGLFKTGKTITDKNNQLRSRTLDELNARFSSVKTYLDSLKGQESLSKIEKSQLIKRILKTNRQLEDLTGPQLKQAKKIIKKEKDRYAQIGSSLDLVITSIEKNKKEEAKKAKKAASQFKREIKKATSQVNKTTSQLRSFRLIDEKHDQSGADIDRLPRLFESRKNQLDPEEMKKFKARFKIKEDAACHLINSLKSKEVVKDKVFKDEAWHQLINKLNLAIHNPNQPQHNTAPNSSNPENTPPTYDYWYLWVTTNALEKLITAVQPTMYERLVGQVK